MDVNLLTKKSVEASGSDVDMDEDAEVSKAKAMAKSLKKEQQKASKATANRDPDDLAEYNLDDYDAEESKGSAMGAFSNIRFVICVFVFHAMH